jgi:hypothetical protein
MPMARKRDHDSIVGEKMSQDCRGAELNDGKAAAPYPFDHKSNGIASDPYEQKEWLETAVRIVSSGKDPWDVIRSCGHRARP